MPVLRAAVFPKPGAPVEVREVPEPDLEPGAALLRVELSEVCGTDVHLRDGRLEGVPYPLIPGHVSVGCLEKIHGKIGDVNGRVLREGERVTFLDVHRTCNACWYCLVAKATTRCPHRKVYGITYGLADGLCGGWAEAMVLKPGTRILPLGDAAPERFMAGGCALPTALHAVQRARVGIGDRVLVLGSGPVGLAAVILARIQGAQEVFCIGAPEGRLQVARAAGANEVLNFEETPPEERVAWIRDRTGGRGADITIEATGAPTAVRDAMLMTRDAGRVVIVGQYTDHGDIAFNPHTDLNRKHLEVLGCWGSDYSHFHRAVELLGDPERARGFDAVKLTRYGFGDLDAALSAVAQGTVVKALVDPGL